MEWTPWVSISGETWCSWSKLIIVWLLYCLQAPKGEGSWGTNVLFLLNIPLVCQLNCTCRETHCVDCLHYFLPKKKVVFCPLSGAPFPRCNLPILLALYARSMCLLFHANSPNSPSPFGTCHTGKSDSNYYV